MTISNELMQAYLSTTFCIDDLGLKFEFQPNVFCPDLQKLHHTHNCQTSALITAFNPYSVAQNHQTNDNLQAQLVHDLKQDSFTLLNGYGKSSDESCDWVEMSVLALNIDYDSALEYATKYKQNAFVWVGPSAIPELVITA